MAMETVEKQPASRPGLQDVTDLVINDLVTRRDAGTKKYGFPLSTFNGRKAEVDLYEELLDSVIYLRQRLGEIDVIRKDHIRLLAFIAHLANIEDDDMLLEENTVWEMRRKARLAFQGVPFIQDTDGALIARPAPHL